MNEPQQQGSFFIESLVDILPQKIVSDSLPLLLARIFLLYCWIVHGTTRNKEGIFDSLRICDHFPRDHKTSRKLLYFKFSDPHKKSRKLLSFKFLIP
jgi:hypothetical protein